MLNILIDSVITAVVPIALVLCVGRVTQCLFHTSAFLATRGYLPRGW